MAPRSSKISNPNKLKWIHGRVPEATRPINYKRVLQSSTHWMLLVVRSKLLKWMISCFTLLFIKGIASKKKKKPLTYLSVFGLEDVFLLQKL